MISPKQEPDQPLTRWRILIVENDPQQRADHVENLTDWGYEVFTAEAQPNAEDAYHSLEEDAIRKARLHCCHLALVDKRLRSDIDRSDRSGLELAEKLAVIGYVILSAYGMPRITDQSSGSWIAVGKQQGPEALKNALGILSRGILKQNP